MQRVIPSRDDQPSSAPARFVDYLSLARPSHWVKHIFIVPGLVLAMVLHTRPLADVWVSIVVGFLSASLLASANYVLNEWLDQYSDQYHPEKRGRAAASHRVSARMVAIEYLTLLLVGGALALQVSPLFALTSALFVLGALAYNVPPLRSKDRTFFDVITESFNNPLRLTLGWAMIETSALPPASLLLGYWMGGAFLMTVKRLAEMRMLVTLIGRANANLYRHSFRGYSEEILLVQILVSSLLSSFFLGVFVVKYRIEYLLALPVLALLFGIYLKLGLKEHSAAQAPERLLREKRLLVITVTLFLLLFFLTWVDLPFLRQLMQPHYVELDFWRGE